MQPKTAGVAHLSSLSSKVIWEQSRYENGLNQCDGNFSASPEGNLTLTLFDLLDPWCFLTPTNALIFGNSRCCSQNARVSFVASPAQIIHHVYFS